MTPKPDIIHYLNEYPIGHTFSICPKVVVGRRRPDLDITGNAHEVFYADSKMTPGTAKLWYAIRGLTEQENAK